MAFDANRELKIEASETSEGTYALRTAGLAKRKRAELEIVGVPAVALHAAAGVLNMIAEYTVNRAEILAGQTVGNVLTVGEEGESHLLLVRAQVAEARREGFLAKLTGQGKGVLRLVDIEGDEPAEGESPARTALATMLLHRAETRNAKDDSEGARKELEASIETFPGAANMGKAPSVEGAGGIFNWQNHLTYEALANLEDDAKAAAEWKAKADARRPG